jgi:hypothetical protein
MPDRRKLAAPVLAQAASFVVVLVIGGFTGHSAPPASPAPHPSTSPPSPAATKSTKGQEPGVIVEVPVTGGIVPHVPVQVLAGRTTVASGTLALQGIAVEWSHALNPGAYQVCAQPPAGLHFTEKSSGALPGWTCEPAVVAAGPTQVIFHLAPSAP